MPAPTTRGRSVESLLRSVARGTLSQGRAAKAIGELIEDAREEGERVVGVAVNEVLSEAIEGYALDEHSPEGLADGVRGLAKDRDLAFSLGDEVKTQRGVTRAAARVTTELRASESAARDQLRASQNLVRLQHEKMERERVEVAKLQDSLGKVLGAKTGESLVAALARVQAERDEKVRLSKLQQQQAEWDNATLREELARANTELKTTNHQLKHMREAAGRFNEVLQRGWVLPKGLADQWGTMDSAQRVEFIRTIYTEMVMFIQDVTGIFPGAVGRPHEPRYRDLYVLVQHAYATAEAALRNGGKAPPEGARPPVEFELLLERVELLEQERDGLRKALYGDNGFIAQRDELANEQSELRRRLGAAEADLTILRRDHQRAVATLTFWAKYLGYALGNQSVEAMHEMAKGGENPKATTPPVLMRAIAEADRLQDKLRALYTAAGGADEWRTTMPEIEKHIDRLLGAAHERDAAMNILRNLGFEFLYADGAWSVSQNDSYLDTGRNIFVQFPSCPPALTSGRIIEPYSCPSLVKTLDALWEATKPR